MAHSLAVALQQAGWIGQHCALKEPNVDVRSEYIDVAEGHIAETCNRTAVMEQLANFGTALSHQLKPLARDVSQFPSMVFHPRIDGGITFDSSIKPQQLLFHRRSVFVTYARSHLQVEVKQGSAPGYPGRLP